MKVNPYFYQIYVNFLEISPTMKFRFSIWHFAVLSFLPLFEAVLSKDIEMKVVLLLLVVVMAIVVMVRGLKTFSSAPGEGNGHDDEWN